MLFILDSITVAATGSVTARVAKELMKRLKLICGRYNVTVITLMHTRKRDKSKPIEMQDLAGSAKLTDLADNVLAIAKCNATEVYVKVLKSRSNAFLTKYGILRFAVTAISIWNSFGNVRKRTCWHRVKASLHQRWNRRFSPCVEKDTPSGK